MSARARRRAGPALAAALGLALLAGCEADPEPTAAERAAETDATSGATAGGEPDAPAGAPNPVPTPEPDAAPEPADPGEAEPAPLRHEPGVPLQARSDPLAVWTGEEVLVVGGVDIRDELRRDGAAYRPGRGWRALAPAPASLSGAYAAAWTGQALLVVEPSAPAVLRYDPALDAWEEREAPEPARRLGAVAGWSGTELLLAGGSHADEEGQEGPQALDDAWAYDPAADRWQALDPLPFGPRPGAVGGWTDAGLVVVGGLAFAVDDDGLRPRACESVTAYDPDADVWSAWPSAPLEARQGAAVAWTGEGLFVWGGDDGRFEDLTRFDDGGLLEDREGDWQRLEP